jgi:mRNA-degrading endonuclease RelE of RelBE toxin-antitoxin system
MADKIAKLLAKLPSKQLKALFVVLAKVNQGDLGDIDVKSLKGYKNRYRVRVGNYRIIFIRNEQGRYIVLLIAKRDDNAFKD